MLDRHPSRSRRSLYVFFFLPFHSSCFSLPFPFSSLFHFFPLTSSRRAKFFLSGEVLGYSTRIASSLQTPNYTLSLFILQGSGPLLAPALLAATIYMSFGRLIFALNSQHLSTIPPRWLTVIFVTGDILGILVQGAGAIVMSLGTLQDFFVGGYIVIAGLALLLFSFSVFLVLLVIFHYQMRRTPLPLPTSTSRSLSLPTPAEWQTDLKALYISSVLILVRSVTRLVEYSLGNNGWLLRNEWTLYIFDAVPMLAVLVGFNFVHPSRMLALLGGGRYVSVSRGVRVVEVEKSTLSG